MQAPLEHQLWEVLKQHAKGLTVSEITGHLDGDFSDSKVWLISYIMALAIVVLISTTFKLHVHGVTGACKQDDM